MTEYVYFNTYSQSVNGFNIQYIYIYIYNDTYNVIYQLFSFLLFSLYLLIQMIQTD